MRLRPAPEPLTPPPAFPALTEVVDRARRLPAHPWATVVELHSDLVLELRRATVGRGAGFDPKPPRGQSTGPNYAYAVADLLHNFDLAGHAPSSADPLAELQDCALRSLIWAVEWLGNGSEYRLPGSIQLLLVAAIARWVPDVLLPEGSALQQAAVRLSTANLRTA